VRPGRPQGSSWAWLILSWGVGQFVTYFSEMRRRWCSSHLRVTDLEDVSSAFLVVQPDDQASPDSRVAVLALGTTPGGLGPVAVRSTAAKPPGHSHVRAPGGAHALAPCGDGNHGDSQRVLGPRMLSGIRHR
jgi:hypothetical protein